MKIVVATGAGMSAESGVPTFRGPDGLWNGRRPEDVATPGAFRRDPKDVWEFYLARRRELMACHPNAGHRAVAGWQERWGECPVITQNVDGLHQAAGSADVLELHGSIWRTRCADCGLTTQDRRTMLDDEQVPLCGCGGLLRPDIVWFGEELPHQVLARAQLLATTVDVLVLVGSSNLVYPAASIPLMALAAGVKVIEVNIDPTPFSDRVTRFIQGSAAEVLPALRGSLSLM